MASNWRFGVWYWGLADGDVRFVACLAVGFGAVPWILLVGKEGNTGGFYAGFPGSVPFFLADAGPTTGYPHFPWGYSVIPDSVAIWP